ncbi:unnamed protein product [Amoebophrya sp. A120]|nr:unnamed protein product [Amoebophrya sp. A120]|eukprot:GSA120T00004135001.1
MPGGAGRANKHNNYKSLPFAGSRRSSFDNPSENYGSESEPFLDKQPASRRSSKSGRVREKGGLEVEEAENNRRNVDTSLLYDLRLSKSFTEEKITRDLQRERTHCEREIRLVRLVLAMSAAVFPVCLPHMWHLTGANSVYCWEEVFKMKGLYQDQIPEELAFPAVLEFSASICTIMLFFATHYIIHSGRIKSKKATTELEDFAHRVSDRRRTTESHPVTRTENNKRNINVSRNSQKQQHKGLFDRVTQTLDETSVRNKSLLEDKENPPKRWSANNLSRLFTLLVIATTFAVLGFCTNIISRMQLTSVKSRFEAMRLVNMGQLNQPCFNSGYLMGSLLIYFVFLIVLGILLYMTHSLKERLRICEKQEGKQERARQRLAQVLEEQEQRLQERMTILATGTTDESDLAAGSKEASTTPDAGGDVAKRNEEVRIRVGPDRGACSFSGAEDGEKDRRRKRKWKNEQNHELLLQERPKRLSRTASQTPTGGGTTNTLKGRAVGYNDNVPRSRSSRRSCSSPATTSSPKSFRRNEGRESPAGARKPRSGGAPVKNKLGDHDATGAKHGYPLQPSRDRGRSSKNLGNSRSREQSRASSSSITSQSISSLSSDLSSISDASSAFDRRRETSVPRVVPTGTSNAGAAGPQKKAADWFAQSRALPRTNAGVVPHQPSANRAANEASGGNDPASSTRRTSLVRGMGSLW